MKRITAMLLSLVLSQGAWAALNDTDAQRLLSIQQRWASIQYQLPEAQRSAAFEQLAEQTAAWVRQQPTSAEGWIWSGIVTSSWAGAEGGLGALGKAKTAKADLEKALSLDPQALQGSAYTSLAALYDRVPGWPIGFGDADKAGQLLQQALALNPDGIDSLYFLGDHLYRQKRYREARQALEKALHAAPRAGRESADAGRRRDVAELLASIDKQHD